MERICTDSQYFKASSLVFSDGEDDCARVGSQLKHDVESVLDQLGLSVSEAICLFMSQVKLNNGLPFKINIPNETTRKTLDEADQDKNLVHTRNIKDLFGQLLLDLDCLRYLQ